MSSKFRLEIPGTSPKSATRANILWLFLVVATVYFLVLFCKYSFFPSEKQSFYPIYVEQKIEFQKY